MGQIRFSVTTAAMGTKTATFNLSDAHIVRMTNALMAIHDPRPLDAGGAIDAWARGLMRSTIDTVNSTEVEDVARAARGTITPIVVS